MLWMDEKTKPPSGANNSIRSQTSRRTSSGVPKGSVFCVSTPPPQKTNVLPYSFFNVFASIPAAEHCTGFKMSNSASANESKRGRTPTNTSGKTCRRADADDRTSKRRKPKNGSASISKMARNRPGTRTIRRREQFSVIHTSPGSNVPRSGTPPTPWESTRKKMPRPNAGYGRCRDRARPRPAKPAR